MQSRTMQLQKMAGPARPQVRAQATRSTGKTQPKFTRPVNDDALWLPNTERPEW